MGCGPLLPVGRGGEERCLWMELDETVRSRFCTDSDAFPMAMMLPTRLWPAHYFL